YAFAQRKGPFSLVSLLSLTLFNLQGTIAVPPGLPPQGLSGILIYHIAPPLSILFFAFFETFFKTSGRAIFASCHRLI
ncbi:MAG: hypothetical protein IKE57_07820, partial [Oscillospiraceae bacterium]|nr:hypothetical protein [Oscillospiraceae bacterium]